MCLVKGLPRVPNTVSVQSRRQKVCLGFQTLFQCSPGVRSLLSAPLLCGEATRSDVWSLLSVHVTITPFWRLSFLNGLNSTGVLRKRAIRHQFGNNKSLPGTFIDKGLQNSGDPSTPTVRVSQGWQNTGHDLLKLDTKFQTVPWRENMYKLHALRLCLNYRSNVIKREKFLWN